MSAMKQLKKLILLAVIWALPLAIGQLPVGVSFGDAAQAAEATKKTRKVPAMRERTYKKLAEAQIMIDPDSAPREEGEPAPIPKAIQDVVWARSWRPSPIRLPTRVVAANDTPMGTMNVMLAICSTAE